MFVPSGVVDLREIAAPAAPAAGLGRLYTKADDKLYIKNTAGVESLVGPAAAGGADPWTFERLAANYTNSTITSTNVFTGFTPAASTTYIVRCLLPAFAAVTTTGIRLMLNGPISGITTAVLGWVQPTTFSASYIANGSDLSMSSNPPGSTTVPALHTLDALVVTGAVGAGLIRLQARSEIAGSLITIEAGAIMQWRMVA